MFYPVGNDGPRFISAEELAGNILRQNAAHNLITKKSKHITVINIPTESPKVSIKLIISSKTI